MKWPVAPPTDRLSPRQLARAHADLARVKSSEDLVHTAASLREYAPDWAADLAASAAQHLPPHADLRIWTAVLKCLAPIPHYQRRLNALEHAVRKAHGEAKWLVATNAANDAVEPSRTRDIEPNQVNDALQAAQELLERSWDAAALLQVANDLREASPELAQKLLHRATHTIMEDAELDGVIQAHTEWGDPERAVWLAWGFRTVKGSPGRDPEDWPWLEARFEVILEALSESLSALEELENQQPEEDRREIRPLPLWTVDEPAYDETLDYDEELLEDDEDGGESRKLEGSSSESAQPLVEEAPRPRGAEFFSRPLTARQRNRRGWPQSDVGFLSRLREFHPALGPWSLEEHRRRIDELRLDGIDLECACNWACEQEVLTELECEGLLEGWLERRKAALHVVIGLENQAARAGRHEIAGGNVRRTLRWGVETGFIPAWLADQVARVLNADRLGRADS